MIERFAITDHDQWMALRSKDITASVAGALLGVHPYITARELYEVKSGNYASDPEETPALRRGRLLEDDAVQIIREDHPEWVIDTHPVGWYYRDPDARVGATPDLFVNDQDGRFGIIQIKTVDPFAFRNGWRSDDGTIEPPIWIVAQAVIEAMLTGAEWAAVAAVVVNSGLELHTVEVPIHAGLYNRIKQEVAEFWRRVEQKDPYDFEYARDGALIAKLYPQDNGDEIDLSADNLLPGVVDQLEAARAAKKAADAEEKTAKFTIAAKMGEAAIARLADGRRISNKSQHRSGYFVEASDYRVLRILKGR